MGDRILGIDISTLFFVMRNWLTILIDARSNWRRTSGDAARVHKLVMAMMVVLDPIERYVLEGEMKTTFY